MPLSLLVSIFSLIMVDPKKLMFLFGQQLVLGALLRRGVVGDDEAGPTDNFLLIYSYGTAKSGVGISAMSVLRPDLMMRSVIPVVMAGIIAVRLAFTLLRHVPIWITGLLH